MDHHLTSPTSRESLARTHARTHAQAHRSRTGERIDVLLPPRPGRPRGLVRRTRASDKSPAQGVERRDHRGGTARDMKGVSGTRGRAMRIEDQGRSGACRAREEEWQSRMHAHTHTRTKARPHTYRTLPRTQGWRAGNSGKCYLLVRRLCCPRKQLEISLPCV